MNFTVWTNPNCQIGSNRTGSFTVKHGHATNEFRSVAPGNENLTVLDNAVGCIAGPHSRGFNSCGIKSRFS